MDVTCVSPPPSLSLSPTSTCLIYDTTEHIFRKICTVFLFLHGSSLWKSSLYPPTTPWVFYLLFKAFTHKNFGIYMILLFHIDVTFLPISRYFLLCNVLNNSLHLLVEIPYSAICFRMFVSCHLALSCSCRVRFAQHSNILTAYNSGSYFCL